jgi:glutathione S-transferase
MKIYFTPLACSLSSRIAAYEAGAPITFVEVDTATKLTADGADFRAVNPLGLVPALELDDGQVLTENAAILQHIAEAFPAAALAPDDLLGRSRLRQWLSFIGAELHKSLFGPLIARNAPAPEMARTYALSKAPARLELLAEHLAGRAFLLGDRFSVADAYLFAVLNWTAVTPVDLAPWPVLGAYHRRVGERPHVARAFAEERELYLRERARERAQQAAAVAAP